MLKLKSQLRLKPGLRLGHDGGGPFAPVGQQFVSITSGTEQFITITDANGAEQRISVATGLS